MEFDDRPRWERICNLLAFVSGLVGLNLAGLTFLMIGPRATFFFLICAASLAAGIVFFILDLHLLPQKAWHTEWFRLFLIGQAMLPLIWPEKPPALNYLLVLSFVTCSGVELVTTIPLFLPFWEAMFSSLVITALGLLALGVQGRQAQGLLIAMVGAISTAIVWKRRLS